MKQFLLTALLAGLIITRIASAGGFEFKDNDRIVLLGGTLIEREQKYGFLETQLTLAAGEKKLTVRNLGWSGDTVFGHARSYFGPPAEGITRLTAHLEMLKPTVLIACYGVDMTFERPEMMPDFIAGYGALLDLVRSKSPNVRIIIIAPPPFENLGASLPDMNAANAKLAKVRDALKEFADKQHTTFVDSFDLMGGAKKERPAQPLTDNGMHYSEAGYKLWASKVAQSLGFPKADFAEAQTETLRQSIIRKDFLFFNRWRPANETYLFGFRKHEQGRNAVEMEQFDPLVDAQEKKIHELKAAVLATAKKLP
jgi:lysophospholipase L1-like esterase